jgi:hypothetical protein
MARYQIDDDSFVNTDLAKEKWDEDTWWNGQNHISKATGSQWEHETLYLSSKGRYYVIHTSQYEGTAPGARWLEPGQAAAWLLNNDHDLPEDLKGFQSSLEE